MMMTPMREEIRLELDRCQVKRPPVIRRSDSADALLACDLPAVASPETVTAFTIAMERRGWTVRDAFIFLLLDKPVPVPPGGAVDAAGDTACCLALLERHPNQITDPALIRAVVKAAEEGPRPLERLCCRLHAEWAEKLRLGQPLPGALLPYLQQAAKEVQA